ncbi:hypothetical protein [Bacillus sp. EB600]|uniref:hypothetical protein n=1 Tax=Bacillus sp. EB600 TaxID=2806345 RepID=UPI0021091C9E|nr:hypothetical protein [Bacillus sp. EB600]MCQ6281532.1 hypothetical protein [Bacillus sp. EB600]
MNYEHLMKHTIRQMERERTLQQSEGKHQLKFMEESFFKVLKSITSIIYKGE